MRDLTTFSARVRARRSLTLLAASIVAVSCTENLPSGPTTFSGVSLSYTTAHDTIVVGDTSIATAHAVEPAGGQIQALTFAWTSSDTNTVALSIPGTNDGTFGRSRGLVGRKTGVANVSMALPDSRFTAPAVSRNQTVVVGGVRVLSSKDTTLTSINDTARAIGAGLARQNGALVPRASLGIRWTHKGTHATVVGTGDTIRYIAVSNGADTLIASHDLCLAGAKCADTAIVRVSQRLAISLSAHTFLSWSLRDSIAPTITLADKRGTGLAGTSIQFVPITAADSAVVSISSQVGISNFVTGAMATPRVVSTGNGSARVAVRALASDGTVIATDTITETVRQVARRIAVEPLRAVVGVTDSIPVRAVARDARGAVIGDATVGLTTTLNYHAPWIGPQTIADIGTVSTPVPTISGLATPEANPLAPQVPVIVDQTILSFVGVDTITADASGRTYSFIVMDSTASLAIGKWVRFGRASGVAGDSVQVGANGTAVATWANPAAAGTYTLTGILTGLPLATLADSSGRIVFRRSVVVVAGAPDATQTSATIDNATVAVNGTATVTILVADQNGNVVKNVTTAPFSVTANRGSISNFSCSGGTCTATYTAPTTSGADAVTVTLNGTNVSGSPIAITVP